jgi:hypothetical protein
MGSPGHGFKSLVRGWWLAGWLLVWAGATAGGAQTLGLEAQASEPTLLLGGFAGGQQRWLERLEALAPEEPILEWAPGLTIARQTGPRQGLHYPVDYVSQYLPLVEYCPTYLPRVFPEQNLGQPVFRTQLLGPQLEQGQRVNPLAAARDQIALLNRDSTARWRRALWLAGYAWVHRQDAAWPEGAVDGLISPERYLRRDVMASAVVPLALQKIPSMLTDVQPQEGEAAVDLLVTSGYVYNSVGTSRETLVTAARRGLQAVVVAGRGEIGEALTAQRLADELVREGQLPEGFRVIPGEYIVSRGGTVLGIFLQERVLEGMTLAATLKAIHRQGGLAYLARPGEFGARSALEVLPFDGLLVQPGNFELFRTLKMLHDPELVGKPALYASSAPFAAGVGLPYSSVPLVAEAADPLYAGLASRQAYAAGPLYMPWMLLLLTKPLVWYQGTLNRFFDLSDGAAVWATRQLKADRVFLRTNWDDGVRDLMSLSKTNAAVQDILSGDSPLVKFPVITYVEVEYGRVGIGYDRRRHLLSLGSRFDW